MKLNATSWKPTISKHIDIIGKCSKADKKIIKMRKMRWDEENILIMTQLTYEGYDLVIIIIWSNRFAFLYYSSVTLVQKYVF